MPPVHVQGYLAPPAIDDEGGRFIGFQPGQSVQEGHVRTEPHIAHPHDYVTF
jgi:hypothetical protein